MVTMQRSSIARKRRASTQPPGELTAQHRNCTAIWNARSVIRLVYEHAPCEGAWRYSPLDLLGKHVSVGPAGSGTDRIARLVLSHLGIGDGAADLRHLTLREARAALEHGELDAAFIVAGLRTPVVGQLLRRPEMQLLSLGDPQVRGYTIVKQIVEAHAGPRISPAPT